MTTETLPIVERAREYRGGDSEWRKIMDAQSALIEELVEALDRIAQPVFVAEPAGTPDSAWRTALNERIEAASTILAKARGHQ